MLLSFFMIAVSKSFKSIDMKDFSSLLLGQEETGDR